MRELLDQERPSTITFCGSIHRWPCPSLDDLTPAAMVYDCMDELSRVSERSSGIAGTRSGTDSARRPGIHRRPQSLPGQEGPAPQRVTASPAAWTPGISPRPRTGCRRRPIRSDLPHPRLGFFGVIDERFDMPLLRAMAERASRLADRAGRTGGEDRPGLAAAGAKHPLLRPTLLSAAARLSEGLGCVPAAVCPQ